jgi:hypothetical protein
MSWLASVNMGDWRQYEPRSGEEIFGAMSRINSFVQCQLTTPTEDDWSRRLSSLSRDNVMSSQDTRRGRDSPQFNSFAYDKSSLSSPRFVIDGILDILRARNP